jgi:hypothetical protein
VALRSSIVSRPGCVTWIAVALAACDVGHAAAPVAPRRDVGHPPAVEVISCIDLPRDDPRSHDLSGLAWDPSERLLYALSDKQKWLVVLAPRPGFTGYDLRPPIPIDLDLDLDRWDGEALAIAHDRFLLVANETDQTVFSVDRTGHDARQVILPLFHGTRRNRGLEGIGYVESAEGHYIFAINEESLEGDGPTSTAARGTVVRILRHPLDGGDDLEVAYLTDPIFADGVASDGGVSDIAPLSRDRLLVLERSWVQDKGNGVRVYEVVLRDVQNVIALADARLVVPVPKRLIVDLALVPDQSCPPAPQVQRSRALENYEGLALGPTLADGRRVVFLVSDDNSNATQAPRMLALALAPGVL